MPLGSLARFAPALKNSGWLLLEKALRIVLILSVLAWVARYLGPAEFGLYNYLIAYHLVFSTLTRAGIDQILQRNMVQDPKHSNHYLLQALLAKTILAVISWAIFILLLPKTPASLQHVLLPFSFLLFLQPLDCVEQWFAVKLESRYIMYAKLASLTFASVARIYLVITKGSLTDFCLVYGLEIAFALLVGLYFFLKNANLPTISFPKKFAVKQDVFALLKTSFPLTISGLSIILYTRVDVFMLEAMQGQTVVGYYTTASALSEVWYAIPVALVASFSPSLLKPENNFYAQLKPLLTYLCAGCWLVVIGAWAASPYLIPLLYGTAYSPSISILNIHILSLPFMCIGLLQSQWGLRYNHIGFISLRSVLALFVNVLLNWLLIPQYGAEGAAVATVATYIISNLISNLLYNTESRQLFLSMLQALFLVSVLGKLFTRSVP